MVRTSRTRHSSTSPLSAILRWLARAARAAASWMVPLGHLLGGKIAFDDHVRPGPVLGVQPVVEGAGGAGQELMIGLGAAPAHR